MTARVEIFELPLDDSFLIRKVCRWHNTTSLSLNKHIVYGLINIETS